MNTGHRQSIPLASLLCCSTVLIAGACSDSASPEECKAAVAAYQELYAKTFDDTYQGPQWDVVASQLKNAATSSSSECSRARTLYASVSGMREKLASTMAEVIRNVDADLAKPPPPAPAAAGGSGRASPSCKATCRSESKDCYKGCGPCQQVKLATGWQTSGAGCPCEAACKEQAASCRQGCPDEPPPPKRKRNDAYLQGIDAP